MCVCACMRACVHACVCILSSRTAGILLLCLHPGLHFLMLAISPLIFSTLRVSPSHVRQPPLPPSALPCLCQKVVAAPPSAPVPPDNHTHLEYPWNPVAIGSRWLAYSDNKLHTHHLSRGGVYVTEEGSYTAKVLDAVEGFRRYASDVYSKYWTGEQQQQQRGGDSKGGSGLAEVCSASAPFS